jgi:hypothetical protein
MQIGSRCGGGLGVGKEYIQEKPARQCLIVTRIFVWGMRSAGSKCKRVNGCCSPGQHPRARFGGGVTNYDLLG